MDICDSCDYNDGEPITLPSFQIDGTVKTLLAVLFMIVAFVPDFVNPIIDLISGFF